MEVGHDPHPLFKEENELDGSDIFVDQDLDDETTGYLYILRSKSQHPFVVENHDLLHKIGFTRRELEDRLSNAANDPTFLMADVDVVASYRIVNASAGKLETILHRFFATARVDVKMRNEVGGKVEPREWFFVSLPSIKEAVKLIENREITKAHYNIQTARIVKD